MELNIMWDKQIGLAQRMYEHLHRHRPVIKTEGLEIKELSA